jgi:RNA polymerase sigma factor (sigma-70 family)
VQEVISEMWERLGRPGFATDRTFDAYVRSLAYWRCIDWLRRRKPEHPVDTEIPGRQPGPERLLLDKERRELGGRILRRLRESCRELIRLHAGRGLTYRQIGAMLGRSEGALRVQMFECLKQARKIREQLCDPGIRVARPRGT